MRQHRGQVILVIATYSRATQTAFVGDTLSQANVSSAEGYTAEGLAVAARGKTAVGAAVSSEKQLALPKAVERQQQPAPASRGGLSEKQLSGTLPAPAWPSRMRPAR
jgi:hypothetical protein